jgi:hypothetical protein
MFNRITDESHEIPEIEKIRRVIDVSVEGLTSRDLRRQMDEVTIGRHQSHRASREAAQPGLAVCVQSPQFEPGR